MKNNSRKLSIVVMSVLFVVLVILCINQDIKNAIIKSDVSEFQAFNVHSDENGDPIVFIPYGIELEGDTDGLNVCVVDTGNPTLIIDVTNNNEIGRGDKDTAVLNMVNGSGIQYMGIYSGDIEIEGLNKPIMSGDKISYSIRLPIDTEMLDMAPEKEWILLSMGNDKSLLRTQIGFELSKAMGMQYTPEARYVELFINGDYKGTYMLCEKIEVSNNRLDISKLSSEVIAGEGISGGYLMQVDLSTKMKPEFVEPNGSNFYFRSGIPNFLPGAGERSQIVVKQSKKLFKVHFDYIKNYIAEAEQTLFSEEFKDPSKGFRVYFDEDSFINWYVIQELFKNPDVEFLNGPYFYKERRSTIKMGPVWNFDFGAGNSVYIDAKKTDGWYVRNSGWYKRMFEDPAFEEAFKSRWKDIRNSILNDLNSIIDYQADALKISSRFNTTKWSVTEDGYIKKTADDILDKEYNDEINALKDWLKARIEWIDSNIN